LGVASGTSYATAFVAATAALVLARKALPGPAVVDRILSTADPSPDGQRSQRYGVGILNPYRAVAGVAPSRMPAGVAIPAVPARAARDPEAGKDRATAVELAAGGLGLAGLVAFLAVVLPRGAQREWRAGRD